MHVHLVAYSRRICTSCAPPSRDTFDLCPASERFQEGVAACRMPHASRVTPVATPCPALPRHDPRRAPLLVFFWYIMWLGCG